MIKSGPVVIMNPLVLSLSLDVCVTTQSLCTVNKNGEFNSKIIGRKTKPTKYGLQEICSVFSSKFKCQFTKYTYEIVHAYFDKKNTLK